MMTRIYVPVAASGREARQARAPLAGLRGKVVGFVDNAKPNFNHLVDDLADALVTRHGVKAVVVRRKRGASIPAPADMVKEVAAAADLVVTGSGD